MPERRRPLRLAPPPDAFGVVATLAGAWIVLQIIGVVVGLTLVGRHGAGPIRHLDARIHDWFIDHRLATIPVAKVLAFFFDAPKLGVIVVLATAAAVALGWGRNRLRWSTLSVFVAFLGAEATVYAVRTVIHRPRPPTAAEHVYGHVAGIHETSWSFPSGHATGSMAVLVALAGMLVLRERCGRWIYAVAVVAAICVAVSRLILAVHWFSDVATGAVLGGLWAIVVCRVAARCDVPVFDEPGDEAT
ncbi:MAG: phosphatase PAP2 family protein [Actinobacteria bacterium]|nr:phosphatase PAP2 family protein [Actinomycetota bacterium]